MFLDVIRLVTYSTQLYLNSFAFMSRSVVFCSGSQAIPAAIAAYPPFLFVGVFVGPCPVFCLLCVVCFLTKRKSGWGICGSSCVAPLFL